MKIYGVVIFLVAILLIGYCWKDLFGDREYRASIKSGRESLQIIKSVHEARLYPSPVDWISHFRSSGPDRVWNTSFIAHGRYSVTIQFPIEIVNFENIISVKKIGAGTMVLNEVVSIDELSNGRRAISYGKQFSVDEKNWDKIDFSKVDFSRAGVELEREKPVGNIERLDLGGN